MALDAYWQTPIGPYSPSFIPGAMIFDSSGNYAYGLMTDVTGDLRIIKITRSTLVITEDEVIAGHGGVAYAVNGDQDTTHLYLTVDDNHIIKVAKSDLTLTATGASPTGSSSGDPVMRLRMGKGWSAGKVWGVMDYSSSSYRVVSWDTATMAEVDNIDISSLIDSTADLIVTDSGDVYVIGNNADGPLPGENALRLIKITSGLSVTGETDFGDTFTYSGDTAGVSLLYDPTDESIFIWTFGVIGTAPSQDKVAKHVLGGVTTYQATDGDLWNTSGYSLSASVPFSFSGVRGVFSGAYNAETGALVSGSNIIMYHGNTLAVVLRIPMLAGYLEPHNLMVDPEGRLWMGAYNEDGDEDWLLVLSLSEALDTVRGYVSWAEMEMPDAAGGSWWYRPTYGRGMGQGMGRDQG